MSKQLKGCGIIAISEFLDTKRDEIWVSAVTMLSILLDNKIEACAFTDVKSSIVFDEVLVLEQEHWELRKNYETTGLETCVISGEKRNIGRIETNVNALMNLKGAKGKAPAPAYSPPPAPSAADTAKAWADAMPQVYETEIKYAPLQAQSELDLLQKYAAPIGQAYKSAMEELYPETAGLQENLALQARQGMTADMPAWMKDAYRDEYSAALGTNVGSPIGADYMSRGMMWEQKKYNDYYRDLALSVSGRQPLAQPQRAQTGNYSQGFTPESVMSYGAQTYGSNTAAYANMYGSQLGYQSAVRGQNMSLAGSVIGGGLSAAGSIGAAALMPAAML